MALKPVKLKNHIVHLQDIFRKVFYCQIARGKWEKAVKNILLEKHSIKCLCQILEDLFVLEDTS